jgi:hypothetical protein
MVGALPQTLFPRKFCCTELSFLLSSNKKEDQTWTYKELSRSWNANGIDWLRPSTYLGNANLQPAVEKLMPLALMERTRERQGAGV